MLPCESSGYPCSVDLELDKKIHLVKMVAITALKRGNQRRAFMVFPRVDQGDKETSERTADNFLIIPAHRGNVIWAGCMKEYRNFVTTLSLKKGIKKMFGDTPKKYFPALKNW